MRVEGSGFEVWCLEEGANHDRMPKSIFFDRKDLGRSPPTVLPSPASAHEAAKVNLAAVFFLVLLPAAGGDGTLLYKSAIAALLEVNV